MLNLFSYTVLFVLVTITLPNTALAFGIGLTPSTIELDVKPGSHHRQVLKIKNFNQNKSIKLTVSVADWHLDDDGQVQLLAPEENRRSASSWVNFSPSVLLLKPGMTQKIIVDINTPLAIDSRGDHRTAIILSTVLPSKSKREGKNGVWNRYQITSLFYANVLPGSSKPKITQAIIRPNDARADTILELQIQNTGSRHSRVKGVIALQEEENNNRVSEYPFKTVLLNDQTRDFEIKISKGDLKPGKYKILIDLKDHGKRIPTSLIHSPSLLVQ